MYKTNGDCFKESKHNGNNRGPQLSWKARLRVCVCVHEDSKITHHYTTPRVMPYLQEQTVKTTLSLNWDEALRAQCYFIIVHAVNLFFRCKLTHLHLLQLSIAGWWSTGSDRSRWTHALGRLATIWHTEWKDLNLRYLMSPYIAILGTLCFRYFSPRQYKNVFALLINNPTTMTTTRVKMLICLPRSI